MARLATVTVLHRFLRMAYGRPSLLVFTRLMFARLVCVVGLLLAVWAPAASASPRPPMSSVSASDVSVAPGLPVAIAATPDGQGFWVVSPTGAVTAEGDATFYGDASHLGLNQPIVGIATTPTGHGYWLVAADGGIFTYGDATFHGSTGSTHLNQPIVGIAATPTGHGYWLVAADGGIFSFGDATFHGSTGSTHLNQPIVGIAATPTGDGYWLVAADGGIFSFGDATFHGSTGSTHLNQPIVGIAATPTGDGYWLVAADGGIFTYGDATFHGSGADQPSPAPALGFIDTAGTAGYWIALTNGEVRAFGTAHNLVTTPTLRPARVAWPAEGAAAIDVPGIGVLRSPGSDTARPIASVAKVMTAYVILRDYPLPVGGTGFRTTITSAQVADLRQREAEDQSTVPVSVGEVLDEYQLLQGLLIPSGNNLAAVLAEVDAGGVGPFVAKMNAMAQALGMDHTLYTDPSGYDTATVSTPDDQVILGEVSAAIPVFAQIVGQPSVTLPVAGAVENYDTLLGTDGFLGIKTGSEAPAGGGFVFVDRRIVDGLPVILTGVVLGQDVGASSTWVLVDAALSASRALADSIVS